MNKKEGSSTKLRVLAIRAIAFAALYAAAVGALAQVPPLDPSTAPGTPSISDKSRALPDAHKVELGDKARPGTGAQRGTAPSDPAVMSGQPPPRAPIDRTGAIVIPRENCGTFWTGWGKDPSANANPCPANCERGERLDVRERKTDGAMQYQAHYRCNLPELVVRQPPGTLREPGAPPRTNCGTFWTTRQSDPNAAANPCPANCERGELLDVRRGRSGDKLYYEMNYRCYMAQPAGSQLPAAPKPTAELVGNEKVRGARAEFQPQVITTEPIVLTGTRRPAFVPQVITTEPIQLTGTRRPPFVPQVIRTEPIELTGTRLKPPALKSDRSIKSEPSPAVVQPVTPR